MCQHSRQLAEDLLRLGQDDAGWALAESVHSNDQYDVTAYNLSVLHDEMDKFATLTNDHFIVHMSQHEAGLYGDQVMDLLSRARETLTRKYSVELTQPTVVEIFPEQKDFAVRTFGFPEDPGYLGVCFGSVITANSPASQAPESGELAGRALARVHPRHLAHRHEEPDAALVERGHFRL